MKHTLVAVLCAAGALLAFAGEAGASCSAQVNCSVTVIYCSGQSSCNSGSNWVQCDSQATIYCPICQAQATCCNGQLIYCNGYSSCQEYSDHVVCDGHFGGFCPDCPNYGSLDSLFQALSQPGACAG